MGISINGPSGIDTASLISQLTELEMQKVYRIQSQSSKVSKQLGAYSQLDTYVNDVATASNKIDSREDFNMFNANSSNEGAVNISTSVGAQPGSYGVKVFQLAEREKMISKDGIVTDNQAELVNDLGITAGTFEINGVAITLEATDTLEELRVKINNAKQDDGSELGVTASVLKTADNNYRFVLTSTDTGSEGAAYTDADGTLQSLGIVKDAAGSKGITHETYESDGTTGNDIKDKFDALADGKKITVSGTDVNGETVNSVFVKTAGETIDDFAKFVENSFHGGVSASVDATTGKMTLADKNGGTSLLNIESFDFDTVTHSFSQTETGNAGSNVLSMGKDAYFSVDNINMSSDTNKASGFVTGVNFELNAVEYDKTVNLSIDRDISGLATKVEELVNSYNAVKRYIDTATRAGNSDENQAAGILKGDLTARNVSSKIRSVFQEKFDLSGSNSYSSLSQIGIKTNTDNGNYELDREEFEDALEDNFDEIVSMFVTEGYTDNSNVIFGTTDDDTEEGIYDLVESGGLYSMTVRGGDGTVYNATREGEIISFDDGPASGLYLTAPTGSGNSSVTFSKGLAGRLNDVVDSLIESETGTLAIRKKSMNSRIDSYGDQETAMQRRVDAYRNRLVKQFSAMEQIMNTLNSQSASMMGQLGMTTQQ